MRDLCDDIQTWLLEAALPLWAEEGVDHANASFVEQLSAQGEGEPNIPRRLRVQARQIYVFSHAALLGWEGPGVDIALRGMTQMTSHSWGPKGGFISALDAQGRTLDASIRLYDHAFALHGFAWLYAASGEPRALEWAYRTLEFILDAMRHPSGEGFVEAAPYDGLRRQSPHMHLFEALLALHEATNDAGLTPEIEALAALFRDRFFDPETGALNEVFDEDWSPKSELQEPGHHYEWCWLLHRYGRAAQENVEPEIRALYDRARRYGTDPETGLVFNAMTTNGPVDEPARLWPQTKALKAHLIMAESFGEETSADIKRAARLILAGYLAPAPPGSWTDRFPAREDETGPAPASSFYHIMLAFAELLRLQDALE